MSQFRKQIQSKPVAKAVDKDRVEQALDAITNDPKSQQAILKELEKELKAETPVEAAPLLEFVLKHIKEIIIILTLFLVGALGWGVWSWQTDKAYEANRGEFKQILTVLDPAARVTQLEAFATKAPAEMKTAVYLEIGTAASMAEQYDKAAENYQLAINSQVSKPLSAALEFSLADGYMSAGKPEKAVEVMEKLLTTATKEMKPMITEQLANYAEVAGDKEKALRAYRELITLSDQSPDATILADYYNTRIAELSK